MQLSPVHRQGDEKLVRKSELYMTFGGMVHLLKIQQFPRFFCFQKSFVLFVVVLSFRNFWLNGKSHNQGTNSSCCVDLV